MARRVVITPTYRGPDTKYQERRRIQKAAQLCKELGREKPTIRLPKEKQP